MVVCDELADCSVTDKLESATFVDEKVALATRAFRAVKMTPEDAETDPMLEGMGEKFPRVILLDPNRGTSVVIESKKRMAAKPLYSAMKKLADKFYEQKLDSVVKKHLKVLAKLDKLAPEEFKLKQKREGVDDPESSKAKKLDKQLEEILDEKQTLTDQATELWELTQREIA